MFIVTACDDAIDKKTDPQASEHSMADLFDPVTETNSEMVAAARREISNPESFEHIDTHYFMDEGMVKITMTFNANAESGQRVRYVAVGHMNPETKALTHFALIYDGLTH